MQIVLRGPSPRSVKLEWRYVFWLRCFQRKTRRRDLPGGAGLASCSWLMPRLRPPPSPERRVEAQVGVNNFVYSQEVAPAFTYVGSSFCQSRDAAAPVWALCCNGCFTAVGTLVRTASITFPLSQSQWVQTRWSWELILHRRMLCSGIPVGNAASNVHFIYLFIYMWPAEGECVSAATHNDEPNVQVWQRKQFSKAKLWGIIRQIYTVVEISAHIYVAFPYDHEKCMSFFFKIISLCEFRFNH